MSLQRARSFLTRVSQNRRLQHQLEAATWDAHHAVCIAGALGLQFTPADLQAAIDEAWGVLTEEDLRGVVGGGGNGRSGTGRVTPDTSGTDTSSPPPGDVSGNSCFFSRSQRR
jgi:predicted ribosomally synthesized peptide with nif11-like leader